MSDFNQLIQSPQPVLVDFFAEWCGPCQTMTPILKEVAQQVQGKARIIKIDIDKNPAVASHYGIRSVPTMLIFKNGQIVWKQAGAMPAKQLLDTLLSHT